MSNPEWYYKKRDEMSLSRQNPKRDGNEKAIVAALERAGARVWTLSGAGRPDLLVFHRGQFYALEVKSSTGRLTKFQKAKHAKGQLPWPIVHSELEAVQAIGAYPGSDL